MDYENCERCVQVVVEGDKYAFPDDAPVSSIKEYREEDEEIYRFYDVEKMRFGKNAGEKDKSVIYYNGHITLSNIPLDAYDYVVNGKSAIEWIMERYAITTDKASGITNNPNDWSREHAKPRYILDLLLSIIRLSQKTNELVGKLPKVEL